MARPKKFTLDFFIHDAYASVDSKLRKLEGRHRLDGYGVYFKILERLCREDGMKLDLSDVTDLELMASDFCLRDRVHLLAIIQDCIKFGLFDKYLWESERIIFSHGLYEQYMRDILDSESIESTESSSQSYLEE